MKGKDESSWETPSLMAASTSVTSVTALLPDVRFVGLDRHTLQDRILEGAERKTAVKCHPSVCGFFFEIVNHT